MNKAELEWRDAILRIGCIACIVSGHGFRQPVQHHLLSGGRRIGHLSSIGLCDPGHHQYGDGKVIISRHPWRKRFEAAYGTEAELLALTQKLVREQRAMSVIRREVVQITEGL